MMNKHLSVDVDARGRKHYPEETKGCYYERVDDCCWICLLRSVKCP